MIVVYIISVVLIICGICSLITINPKETVITDETEDKVQSYNKTPDKLQRYNRTSGR